MKQKHPEDLIYETKKFVQNLARVQDQEFNTLVETLGLTKLGEEFLFDFVYNEISNISFEEYLDKYGRSFGEFK